MPTTRRQRAGVHVVRGLDVRQRRRREHELAVRGAVEARALRRGSATAGARPGSRCSSSAIACSLMPYRRAASARSSHRVDDHPAGSAASGRRPRRAPTRRTSPRRRARRVVRCEVLQSSGCRHLGIVDLGCTRRDAVRLPPCSPGRPRTSRSSPDVALPVQVRDSSTGPGSSSPRRGTDATLYVCGITPYDATHLGHAATYVAFDVLGRAWRDAGPPGPVRVERHRRRRPAAGARRRDRRRLARPGRRADRALRRGHDGAGRHPARRVLGRGRGHPRGRRGRRGAARRRRRLPRADARRAADDGLGDVYADLSADIDFGAVAGLDDDIMRDPVRRARRRPRAAPASVHRSTRCCGAASAPASPPGTAARSADGRPGWHIECAVIARDAPRAAVRRRGRRLGPAVPAPRDEHVARPPARRRATARGCTCTPAWSVSTGTR